jgi:hypothetical protein
VNKIFMGVAALGAALLVPAQSAVAANGLDASGGKALFCSFGGIGMQPSPLPPGFEAQFAVAVVEINRTREIRKAKVSDFVLFDQSGQATNFKRVVSVEVFDRPRLASEGDDAYYLNPGNTQPWDGTLPAGRIYLRIKVALLSHPTLPVRFRLVVGRQVIEGPINGGEWPT